MYITRLTSNEIFSPSNKIHREVGRAKDISAPRYTMKCYFCSRVTLLSHIMASDSANNDTLLTVAP